MTELEESPTEAVDHDITPLLQPLQVRGLRLRNRFVMPGMQRYWCADGAPDRRLRESTAAACWAAFPGLFESCAVDHPSATKNPTFARISPDTREAWRACVAGVQEAGGAMFLQLWHQGAVNYGGCGKQPGLRRAEPVGPVASGWRRSAAPPRRRSWTALSALRPGRAGRPADRHRRGGAALSPRFPARPVPVAGHRPAHRPLRRAFDHRSRDVRRRGDAGGARGDRA